jgi:hypothetical protein
MKAHTWTFTAPMPGGPWRRLFHCPHAFDEYVRAWRADLGDVTFDTPWVARGAL